MMREGKLLPELNVLKTRYDYTNLLNNCQLLPFSSRIKATLLKSAFKSLYSLTATYFTKSSFLYSEVRNKENR
jgi:hypothetical protein